jgi:hypothetical protein
VTFKDLQKLVEFQSGGAAVSTQILKRLGGKEFWHWESFEHKRKDIAYKGDIPV